MCISNQRRIRKTPETTHSVHGSLGAYTRKHTSTHTNTHPPSLTRILYTTIETDIFGLGHLSGELHNTRTLHFISRQTSIIPRHNKNGDRAGRSAPVRRPVAIAGLRCRAPSAGRIADRRARWRRARPAAPGRACLVRSHTCQSRRGSGRIVGRSVNTRQPPTARRGCGRRAVRFSVTTAEGVARPDGQSRTDGRMAGSDHLAAPRDARWGCG